MKFWDIFLKYLTILAFQIGNSNCITTAQITKVTATSQTALDFSTLREALESLVTNGPSADPIIYSLQLTKSNIDYPIDINLTIDLGLATLSLSSTSFSKIVFNQNVGRVQCDQSGRNFDTLAKNYRYLAI